jgi:hypothetical protein
MYTTHMLVDVAARQRRLSVSVAVTGGARERLRNKLQVV